MGQGRYIMWFGGDMLELVGDALEQIGDASELAWM